MKNMTKNSIKDIIITILIVCDIYLYLFLLIKTAHLVNKKIYPDKHYIIYGSIVACLILILSVFFFFLKIIKFKK